tara:strand:- start:70 stop:291 length:222 start_codon:yes stop_codon:yes gene_type:complete
MELLTLMRLAAEDALIFRGIFNDVVSTEKERRRLAVPQRVAQLGETLVIQGYDLIYNLRDRSRCLPLNIMHRQ